jgi:superfamily I DNA/RNA helicase
MKKDDLGDLLEALDEYKEHEVYKLTRANREIAAQGIEDKVETIINLASGASTVDELEQRIDQIFSDYISPVTLSTVHKAKGLEAKTVSILQPELLEGLRAKSVTDQQQERNIKYVAVTRSQETLNFVRDVEV